jgi:hypothetical protein
VSGAPAPMRLAARITCPSCGRAFIGHWTEGSETAAQQCPCGHVAEATWPGFTAEPETIVLPRPAVDSAVGKPGGAA